jgi:predicted enzyme related to lactoylglutathione lyase
LIVAQLSGETAKRHPAQLQEKEGKDMKLAFTRIVTQDVPALVRFYREITGITPAVITNDYAEFPNSGATLAISSQRTMDMYGARATAPASNRSAILDFQVDDVDTERARLEQTIGEFVLEPTNQPWGNRSMLFRDPDGNLINFFTPLRPAGK